jgi:DNA-binding winged helix-turn-helix (wHTH) protein/Flp pilus assembly protein TadD
VRDGLRYLFENFALDAHRRELLRDDKVVRTTRQVFDLLEYLVVNRDHVVTKEDLFTAVWSGRIVSESALTTRLNAVRQAIGDSGHEQRLIRTSARKGYRFVGDVRVEAPHRSSSFETALYRGGAIQMAAPSLSVVPFFIMDASLQRATRWQSIDRDLRSELGKSRWLRLIVGNRNSQDCAQEIFEEAKQRDARYVLVGSVRLVAGRCRFTIELIEVETRLQLWSGRLEQDPNIRPRDLDDLVTRLAAMISAALLRREQQRAAHMQPHQLGAWEAYQLGLLHMSRCDPGENQTARAFFERSIDLYPEYAPGYCALAWSYMMSASIFSEMPITEGCNIGDSLLLKALDIDEENPEPHARLALSDLLKGNLDEALRRAGKVLDMNPACADALGVQGAGLVYSNRREDSRLALNKYLSLTPRDPARPIRLSQLATSHYLDENYEAAAAVAKDVVRRYPTHPMAYRWLAASLGKLGKSEEARDALKKLQQLSPASFEMYVKNRPHYCSIEHAPMLDGLRRAGLKF